MTKPMDRLKALYLENSKRKAPNFPDAYRVVPKYSDKTANGLTNCVVDYLNFSGHMASRINNMGTWRADESNVKGGFYTRSNQMKGIADITSCIKVKVTGIEVGISVWWEVKIGADKQSESQRLFADRVRDSGGHYYVVKSFDDFIRHYDTLMLQYT
jgi:hypothetical protein